MTEEGSEIYSQISRYINGKGLIFDCLIDLGTKRALMIGTEVKMRTSNGERSIETSFLVLAIYSLRDGPSQAIMVMAQTAG